jgi:hypothetical protein
MDVCLPGANDSGQGSDTSEERGFGSNSDASSLQFGEDPDDFATDSERGDASMEDDYLDREGDPESDAMIFGGPGDSDSD